MTRKVSPRQEGVLWLFLLVVGWAFQGCKRDEDPPPMPEPSGAAAPPPTTVALPVQVTNPTGTTLPTAAPLPVAVPLPTVAPFPVTIPLPAATPGNGLAPQNVGRSPTPTPQEFDSQREVTVRHSSSLRCETKMVREWLRVRCPYTQRTGSMGGGDVQISRSTHPSEIKTRRYSSPMEAILPVVPGCSHKVFFIGDWGNRWLTAEWPASNAQPQMYFDQPAKPADCRVPSDCPGGVCCYLPTSNQAFCSTDCDLGNTTYACKTDADCPLAFGTQKLRCVPKGGYRICQ